MPDSVVQDLKYALRSFCRTPILALTIIISIALGIAANTTIFSMVNELLIRDMPVRDPAQLSVVLPDQTPTSSYPEYLDFRDQSGAVFEGLAAHSPFPLPANISTAGTPQRVWGQMVSGNWFPLTGIPLYLGRGVLPVEDEVPGRDAVIVLAHSLWQRLGADDSIVGKHVVLSGISYTVVGVTPPGFMGLDRGVVSEFWIPLAMRTRFARDIAGNELSRDNRWLEMTGRIRTGVSREQVLASLSVIYARMIAEHENGRPTLPLALQPTGKLLIFGESIKLLLAVLSVVVVLVLLIACANVANLLLTRAAERQPEIAVRLAVGASRGRLVRQLLTESVLLAGVGAGVGFLLSIPGMGALSQLQPPLPIPIRFNFSPDTRVLVFTTALAFTTSILFGLAPAMAGTRRIVGVRFHRTRMPSLLVGLQVLLSVVLLVASGLFLRSLQKAASIDIGLKPEGVLLFSIDTKGQGYSAENSRRFFQALQHQTEAVPGVESMSYMDLVPLSMSVNSTRFTNGDTETTDQTMGYRYRVGPRFFQTSGISLLRGRDFDPVRDENSRVAIINQTLARRLFGDANPIGRHIRPRNEKTGYEVIGLVGGLKVQTLGENDRGVVFHPLSDFGRLDSNFGATVLIRTTRDPNRMIDVMRREVASMDPNLPLFNIKSLSRHVDEALLVPRLSSALFGIFGITGLTLAIIGLYAVINHSVRSRTREIGIRMALGAPPSAVAAVVARKGFLMVVTGLVLGLAGALAASRFVASFLYGVTPTDWATFATVPVLLFAAAAVAIYFPARRASRVEPIYALRHE